MRFVDDASLRLHSTALHGSLIMIRQMVLTLQPIETSPSQMMPKAFTQIDAIKACINLSQSFKCLIASEQTKAIYMPTTPRPDSVIEDRSMNWGFGARSRYLRSRYLMQEKSLHPTVFCGMQLLIPAWETFWRQSPQFIPDKDKNLSNIACW